MAHWHELSQQNHANQIINNFSETKITKIMHACFGTAGNLEGKSPKKCQTHEKSEAQKRTAKNPRFNFSLGR